MDEKLSVQKVEVIDFDTIQHARKLDAELEVWTRFVCAVASWGDIPVHRITERANELMRHWEARRDSNNESVERRERSNKFVREERRRKEVEGGR